MLGIVCTLALSSRRAVVPVAAVPWDMPVRYNFDAESFGDNAVVAFSTVLDAMAEIEKAARGVTFERDDDAGLLHIVYNESACQSYVGFLSFNEIRLSPRCAASTGIVIHELMHALGFKHEQTHPNRSTFLDVSNRTDLYEDNWYLQWAPYEGRVLATPFDPCSIMMYEPDSELWADHAVNFTEAGLEAAMKCIPQNRHLYRYTGSVSDYVNRDHNNVVQRRGLSARDIAMLNTLYPSEAGDGLDQRIVFYAILSVSILLIALVAYDVR